MVSRAERSLFSDWWWTVDRLMIGLLVALMIMGLILLMGGGFQNARRLQLPAFYFLHWQAVFLVPTIICMVIISFLSPRYIRRLGLVAYCGSVLLVLAAVFFGPEYNGAHRWIRILGVTVQPSEFLKPTFVVMVAWAFSSIGRQKGMPGIWLGFLLLPITIVPLVMQPDLGQTLLITMIWGGLFFIAGLHWLWVAGIAGLGSVGILGLLKFYSHARERLNAFLDQDSAASFQTRTAMEAINNGGWYGVGPGEGTVKKVLPDGHTDFIFAVTGEELGVIVCLLVVLLFTCIVLRGLYRARQSGDSFSQLAVTGLIMQIGLQACINMAVNVRLMPAKGMTLPFISYGGSSLLSLALTTGFLLALTRRRPLSESLTPYGVLERKAPKQPERKDHRGRPEVRL